MAIYTLTLNPAIDLETTVPVMAPGDKLRCGDPVRDPGGGGIQEASSKMSKGCSHTFSPGGGLVVGWQRVGDRVSHARRLCLRQPL